MEIHDDAERGMGPAGTLEPCGPPDSGAAAGTRGAQPPLPSPSPPSLAFALAAGSVVPP